MERYCTKNKCYYHGSNTTCPICGTPTKPVNEVKYKPTRGDHGPYTLREIGG